MHQLPTQRVADKIRAAMSSAGVSQTTLASALSMSQASVSRRLTGEVPFDVNELEVVARALGVTASSLVEAVA